MPTFNMLDESVIGSDPSGILSTDFSTRLRRLEDRPNIFAELCVLDMLLTISRIHDSYYKERLILKGGYSVRTYVPLHAHRFSYDLDFNIHREGGHTFREVQDLCQELSRFAETRRSRIRGSVTLNNQRFHWITFNYRQVIEETYGVTIPEEPKIEICKDCRTVRTPVENEIVTIADPKLLAVTLPNIKHLDLDEQLSNKLYVIGVVARQRRHLDIFDCYRIVEFKNSELDWKMVRDSFHAQLRRGNAGAHIGRARRLIANALRDSNTIRRIESSTFQPFDFKDAANIVSGLYSKLS
jgi:predicted nucleotidyltransferase component of viral defense system